MKAVYLLKHNIDTLLRARGQTRHDLAVWCRRSDPWLSKILSDTDANTQKRSVPLKYLDRIAEFFGIATYQLLQPGISPLTERRKGDRRKVPDRRISARPQQLATTPIRQIAITPEDEALLSELHELKHAEYQRVRHWIAATRVAQGLRPAATDRVDRTPTTVERPQTTPRTRKRRGT